MALGIPLWASGLCFALCGYVVGTVVQEFWRGGKIRRKNTGTDMVTAIIGLVGRNKRRYGGYIVHVGVVLICLGFAGNGSKKDQQVLLKPGQEAKLGRYVIRNDGVKVNDDGQKQTVTAYLPVFVNGKQVDTLYPAKWYFRKHEQEPTTEVAIRRTLAEDLYIVMAAPPRSSEQIGQPGDLHQPAGQLDLDRVRRHRARHRHRAAARARVLVRRRASCRSRPRRRRRVALMLAFMLLGGTTTFAQHMPGAARDENIQSSYYARNDFEKQLQHEIVCTCGALRSRRHRRVPQGSVRHVAPDARGARDADRPEEKPRRNHSVVRRPSTATSGCSARRSTRASPGSRGWCRTWSAHQAQSWWGSRRCAGRGVPNTRPRPLRPLTLKSTSASTMNSATSTNEVRLKADAAPIRPAALAVLRARRAGLRDRASPYRAGRGSSSSSSHSI